jgi:hypothetical protein
VPNRPTTVEVLFQVKARLEHAVNEGIKKLLEDKHLYQSFKIDTKLQEEELSVFERDQLQALSEYFENYITSRWQIEPAMLPGGPPTRRLADRPDVPHVAVDSVKLFCGKCNRVEPYNLVHAADLYGDMEKWRVPVGRSSTQQAILLAYQCQSCKAAPEIFLLSRNSLRVTLDGRSPMERAQVPEVVPKAQRKFFGDAVIAFQAGQVLPALFMLRTFIEQFAAASVAATANMRADDILDRYIASLDDRVRAHFPSLRDIYARLSVAIHSANADSELFEDARAQVIRHLDARRLYGAA